jgi:hypothetical protein
MFIFLCSPLDGADESLSSVEVPRRLLTTPRRMMPVRSMIEGDTEQFLYWQKLVSKLLFRHLTLTDQQSFSRITG